MIQQTTGFSLWPIPTAVGIKNKKEKIILSPFRASWWYQNIEHPRTCMNTGYNWKYSARQVKLWGCVRLTKRRHQPLIQTKMLKAQNESFFSNSLHQETLDPNSFLPTRPPAFIVLELIVKGKVNQAKELIWLENNFGKWELVLQQILLKAVLY